MRGRAGRRGLQRRPVPAPAGPRRGRGGAAPRRGRPCRRRAPATAYADSIAASYQSAPEITGLRLAGHADGIEDVIEDVTTMQTPRPRWTEVRRVPGVVDPGRRRPRAGRGGRRTRRWRSRSRRARPATPRSAAADAPRRRQRDRGREGRPDRRARPAAGHLRRARRAAPVRARAGGRRGQPPRPPAAAEEAAEQAAQEQAQQDAAADAGEPGAERPGPPGRRRRRSPTRSPTPRRRPRPPRRPRRRARPRPANAGGRDRLRPRAARRALPLGRRRSQLAGTAPGLTMGAWRAGGKYLPHYSVAQYQQSTPISPSQLRPG